MANSTMRLRMAGPHCNSHLRITRFVFKMFWIFKRRKTDLMIAHTVGALSSAGDGPPSPHPN